MAGVISNIPRGFNSLLGLRDMGDVPRFVSDAVAATVDITPFLVLEREVAEGSATMTVLNRFGLITVPPGELWYVHQWGAATNQLAAGDSVSISLGMIRNDKYVPMSLQATASAGARAQAVVIEDFWASSGDELSGSCDQIITALGIGLTSRCIYSKFRL